jgi:hypothetical protein
MDWINCILNIICLSNTWKRAKYSMSWRPVKRERVIQVITQSQAFIERIQVCLKATSSWVKSGKNGYYTPFINSYLTLCKNTLRSNFLGTTFVIYSHGRNPLKRDMANKKKDLPVREELGAVLYVRFIILYHVFFWPFCFRIQIFLELKVRERWRF